MLLGILLLQLWFSSIRKKLYTEQSFKKESISQAGIKVFKDKSTLNSILYFPLDTTYY